jgi:hypothetical protein
MVCEHCLREHFIPKLREDDIAVLQYLYNNNINVPQIAQSKYDVSRKLDISHFRTGSALCRLECYNMVEVRTWSKAYSYFINDNGEKSLQTLINQIGG